MSIGKCCTFRILAPLPQPVIASTNPAEVTRIPERRSRIVTTSRMMHFVASQTPGY
jgi:hypothetical protein